MDRFTSKGVHRMQEIFIETPTLTYPDPSKRYNLFLDASKYCLGATLWQYTSESDNLDDPKSITSISGKLPYTQ